MEEDICKSQHRLNMMKEKFQEDQAFPLTLYYPTCPIFLLVFKISIKRHFLYSVILKNDIF